MTPTEQDKELRKRIEIDWLWLTHTCSAAEQESVDRTLDKMVQLITDDRKRVALEARLDENTRHLSRYKEAKIQPYAGSMADWFSQRIAEIKAQQEEV